MVRESATQSYRAGGARVGLTLIEVLAVIAIIGLLIGLLLPAVQAARESSRRSTCATTLTQWGRAIQGYEQSYGILPLGYSEYRCVQHPWVPALWPYIDQQTLADRYNWDIPYAGTPNITALTVSPVGPMTQRLPNYYCPSDNANAGNSNLPKVNYVVNATTLVVGGKKYCGPFNRTRQNGWFSYCGPQNANLSTASSLGFRPLVGRGYVGPSARRLSHVLDGLSNTLMMAEAIAGGGSDPRGRLAPHSSMPGSRPIRRSTSSPGGGSRRDASITRPHSRARQPGATMSLTSPPAAGIQPAHSRSCAMDRCGSRRTPSIRLYGRRKGP
jgi:type II secretory pathway pseudopilin PulG